MTSPKIFIQNVTRGKISNKEDFDSSLVDFYSPQSLVNWEARADGYGLGQGVLVGKPSEVRETWNDIESVGFTWNDLENRRYSWEELNVVLKSDEIGDFTVDDEELQSGDKTYRINIYGKNKDGEWTPYDG